MPLRHDRWAGVACLVVATSALVTFGASCVETDSFRAGDVDAAREADVAPVDATTSAADAALPEADAGEAGKSQRFCESTDTPAYCADFDDGAPLDGWKPGSVDPQSALALSTDAFRSAPRGVRLAIGPGDAGSSDSTIMQLTNARFEAFSVEADILVERAERGPGVQMFQINIGTDSILRLRTDGRLFEPFPTYVARAAFPTAHGEWTHVRFEIRTTPTPVANVTVGLTTISDIALSGPWVAGRVAVKLGVAEARAPSAGWSVVYDNVVVRRL